MAQVADLDKSVARVTSLDERLAAASSGLKSAAPAFPRCFLKEARPPEEPDPDPLGPLSAPALVGTVAIQNATMGAPRAPKM